MPGKEKKTRPLPLTQLTAITTLDGRYRKEVVEIASYVSEFNIIRTRFEVEGRYLIALSDIGIVRPLTLQERHRLNLLGDKISLSDAQKIKIIEEEIGHDAKSVEKGFRTMLQGTSMEDLTEMVHIGLTSEDVNNLTYRLVLRRSCDNILIPVLDTLIDELSDRAERYKATPMLARTHGQAAIPTTLGHEFAVYARRLNKDVRNLQARTLEGKLNGAVGNFNALHDRYPHVNWFSFAENFVRSFGFEPNLTTTQIAPYEDMIEDFQTFVRINNIIKDFDQDVWRYISDNWFVQEPKEDEVGSSTMPQKINPIKFENSEGNLGKANALFNFFAEDLAISRLQRDLSDSTVIREMGAPLGWSLLAYKNTLKGLSRVYPHIDFIAEVLNSDWSILAEPAQVRMRTYGVEDPYTIMKKLTRGKRVLKREWAEIVDQLPLTDEQKNDLKTLTPLTYLGLAVEATERALTEIQASRHKAA